MSTADAREPDRPLLLVGMSGVGKSFWAQRLVEERGFHRHDCDRGIAEFLSRVVRVEPHEQPVHALGRWMGMPWTPGYGERENAYLSLEHEVTERALAKSLTEPGPQVIDATGSIIYLSPRLLDRARANCRVVYLRTPPERRAAMLARYLSEPKPVVWGGAFEVRDGETPEAALPRAYGELLELRDARYLALAQVTLDGGELERVAPSVDEFLARVLAR